MNKRLSCVLVWICRFLSCDSSSSYLILSHFFPLTNRPTHAPLPLPVLSSPGFCVLKPRQQSSLSFLLDLSLFVFLPPLDCVDKEHLSPCCGAGVFRRTQNFKEAWRQSGSGLTFRLNRVEYPSVLSVHRNVAIEVFCVVTRERTKRTLSLW